MKASSLIEQIGRERKKRAAKALAYNGLIQSWPEIARLAREGGAHVEQQAELFESIWLRKR